MAMMTRFAAADPIVASLELCDGTWAVELDELSLFVRLVALVGPPWQRQIR